MSPKKSLIILLRIIFVLFSLQFVRDALYKWDGYSYYMRFADFFPEMLTAFFIWTITGAIIAFAIWITIYGFFKAVPKAIMNIRYENIVMWSILCFLLLVFKKIFMKNVSSNNLFGLNYIGILLISIFLVTVSVWLLRKHTCKILSELNNHITPLVWLFTLFLILTVPFSIFSNKSSDIRIDDTANTSRSDVSLSKKQDRLSSEKRPPNIILVVMDSLTARDMQVYGYDRPTTPFISKWAKDATVFNRAYASSNWTSPAVMSMMTGQRPWTHKAWYRVYYNPISTYKNNLTEMLHDNGYAIYGFVQNHYAHPEILGIKEAFMTKDKFYTFLTPNEWWPDIFAEYFVNKPIVQNWIYKNPIIKVVNRFRPDTDITSAQPQEVYNRFLSYISQLQQRKNYNPDQPFFSWLHVLPPHNDYLPSRQYMGVFGEAEKLNTSKKQQKSKILYQEYKPARQKEVDILRKRYDEFILYSDRQYEIFLSQLAKMIDMSNTIIILTSDHGEIFSHGYQAHDGPHLYEPLVHIPLIVKTAGQNKSRIVDMAVEQIDIAPTILELAGISVPSWMEGRSLYPLLEGKTLQPRSVFSMQLIENRSFGHPITKGTIAVWDGNYKLINYLEDNQTLLFDLESDPDETVNLSNEKPELRKRLMKIIADSLFSANKNITKSLEN